MGTADGRVIECTKVINRGPADLRFNLVIVAEGYRENELSLFRADVNTFTDQMFAMPPFDEMKCAINVYRIDVASTDSGADDPATCSGGTGATAATYFDATFCGNGVGRKHMTVDTLSVINVVESYVPEWHQILVIVNSTIFGVALGEVGITTLGPSWKEVTIHEFGHSAFDLHDEYNYGFEGSPYVDPNNYTGTIVDSHNVTTNINRTTIKWGDLIASTTPLPTQSSPDCTQITIPPNPYPDWTIGAYEGAAHYHCGIYRPQHSCMMRTVYSGFCGVCQRHIKEMLTPFMPEWQIYRWRCVDYDLEQRKKCTETRDIGFLRCRKWRDDGYWKCKYFKDEGRYVCTSFKRTCRKWLPWPLNYICALYSWTCKAFVWIPRLVCASWVWVRNMVCVSYEWVTTRVCVSWRWITVKVCRLWERAIGWC